MGLFRRPLHLLNLGPDSPLLFHSRQQQEPGQRERSGDWVWAERRPATWAPPPPAHAGAVSFLPDSKMHWSPREEGSNI